MPTRTAEIIAQHRQLMDVICAPGTLDIDVGTIQPIDQGALDEVAGSPSKSVVCDQAGRPVGVLMVANEVKPGLTRQGAECAAAAREVLGADLGDVILQPLATGMFEERSYVFWPWQRVLSSLRPIRIVQREMLKPRVFNWLRGATQRAAVLARPEDLEPSFVRPLRSMASDERFPRLMQQCAEGGLKRLEAGEWHPRFVFVHNDFWLGNFLLPRDREARRIHRHGFVVIDWASADPRGYPFFDLLRFSRTSRVSARRLRREVREHCRIVECTEEDALAYLLVTIGGADLSNDHFPEARFLAASRGVFDTLSSAFGIGPLP
jgi:hypothetical protein